jgi:hypothetical protein
LKGSILGPRGGSHGLPVLKQLFDWIFRDQAQDQAPGIRKLQSMPGRSVPAEGNRKYAARPLTTEPWKPLGEAVQRGYPGLDVPLKVIY